MKNLTVVVAWHGGSPKVSTSYTDPRGSTLSPKNPRRQALTGSSFSLPIPILSKADAKMMSTELPLSTRTLWIVLLATMVFITRGSSWGCCKIRENSNFLKNGKMVISVKIQNFSRSWMTKRTSTLESSREI